MGVVLLTPFMKLYCSSFLGDMEGARSNAIGAITLNITGIIIGLTVIPIVQLGAGSENLQPFYILQIHL